LFEEKESAGRQLFHASTPHPVTAGWRVWHFPPCGTSMSAVGWIFFRTSDTARAPDPPAR